MSFGSALVFPGGKADQADEAYSSRFGVPLLHSTALRETFEQTGLFFAEDPVFESQKIERLNQIRLDFIASTFANSKEGKQAAFQALSVGLGPCRQLLPFVRMITVPFLKSRYDATFLVLPAEEQRCVNLAKFAEHDRHLHSLQQVRHCPHEYSDCRWLNPAQILSEHFRGISIVAPPQFIMLNIMLRFQRRKDFLLFLKDLTAAKDRNCNLGPNVISLVPNQGSQRELFPFAATLVGDHQFPYDRIIATESCPRLKQEVLDWRNYYQGREPHLNRYLFKESKAFFESEFEVVCSDSGSVMREMQGWQGVHESLSRLLL